jgi:lipoprotein-anchoring transpeptidase ErfK/SrfK
LFEHEDGDEHAALLVSDRHRGCAGLHRTNTHLSSVAEERDVDRRTARIRALDRRRNGRSPLSAPARILPHHRAARHIIVYTSQRYLYVVQGNNRALRYGIGVGREGFQWAGLLKISRKAEWPDWIPPAEMITRQPYLPRWMAGGPGNPLGARAMYLGTTRSAPRKTDVLRW